MIISLGRNGLIGLAVGATASLGLIGILIYRERVVQGLSPEQQLELRIQLDQVLSCVASLRSEVAELRGGLQDIALQIIQDVKGVEDSQRVRRRRHVNRERTDSTSSSSIYFTASQDVGNTNEETSEGYSTAYAESEYTEPDEDEPEPEPESEEDEEERSCATVLTLRQEDSQEEEERKVEEEEEEEEEEGRLWMEAEVPHGELALLLAQSDILHTGDATLKADGFQLLLDNRAEQCGDSRDFLWRLARAYKDMYECAKDKQEKSSYAQKFAMLTRLSSEHESMHSKLKSGHILKQEHLDRALALSDEDPVCYYLLGRWCYELQVATFDWLEKKAAAALYRSTPTASIHDALENFLKLQAEELRPGFSRNVRLYIAKCHKDLGNISEATNWTRLALKMPT
uniref:Regulator of microtubule dynamics protein 3 n=1 Tax=Xiphophorus couchianus TaxID=32473 RepID=A0A3B5LHH6_9TELE